MGGDQGETLRDDQEEIMQGSYKMRKKSAFRQFLLVMWKNLLLRKRHWLLTIFEIIIPVLLFTILLSVRVLPDSVFIPKVINTTTSYHVAFEHELKAATCQNFGEWVTVQRSSFCYLPPTQFVGDRKFFYGPPGNFTERVASHVAQEIGLKGIFNPFEDVLEPVNSTEHMNHEVQAAYLLKNQSAASYYIGLFFKNTDGNTVPDKLEYDIRLPKFWRTALIYPFLQIPGPRDFNVFSGIFGAYNMGGFTLIQSLVDRYFISELTGDDSFKENFTVETQMYPYPPYVQDNGMSQLYGSMLPTFVVLSLVLLSPSLIKSIVYEKETGVRELVKLMGMNRWIGWLGWFFHSMVIILLVSAFITIMLKASLTSNSGGGLLPPILAHSDGSLIWVLLLIYGVSSIAFCMAISTFFNRPTLATTMGILLWLSSYFIPRTMMDLEYDFMSLTPKILSCLLPNMAITWAFRIIAMFEGRNVGLRWDRLWETGNPRDQLTGGMILIMLVADTLIFLLITWYFDQVNPGAYGVAEPWHFPFQRSYWCGTNPKQSAGSANGGIDEFKDEYFEEEPVGLKPGIVIRNLRKEFRSLGQKTKVAVENVSFNCYEGQCTVLLGHNGAGKTTTMSVLTGVFAPTSGYAEVGGWNIATHLTEARQEVGLCPQHNMLFVDLTVFQHLLFFGRLKGMTTKAAQLEAKALMNRLELTEKKNMFGSQLSGGMKRKLCLAISLIGGSKVVILDEPSSGLDPESRRWVWEVVQRERGVRTILVTTHHMEEADVLGDRVAIMAAGKVVAAGSTLFLKHKFGDGYTLTLMISEVSDVVELTNIVNKFLPEAKLRSNQGGEMTFKLPPKTSHFAPLLDSLTSRKSELGIRHLGLSLTSMEQVFLRVGSLSEGEGNIALDDIYKVSKANAMINGASPAMLNGRGNASTSQRFLYNSQSDIEVTLTGSSLVMLRLKAFFAKRYIYAKRKWMLLIVQLLLPVLVTIMCLAVDASFNEDTDQEPSLPMNISIYPPSNYCVHANIDPVNQILAEKYEELFYGGYKVSYVDNVEETLLEEGRENLIHYRERSIASAQFLMADINMRAMRVMYQSVPFHTPGVSMSLATNALLLYATNSSEASITTNNYPLPPNRAYSHSSDDTSASAMVYSMMMPSALAFLSASFLVFPLQERESKAKQVQVMTGAPLWSLWFTSFVWDLMAYSFSAIVIFVSFMIGDTKALFTVDAAPGALLLLLLMYGWGSIPMAYVFSFPFQTAASGFAVLAVLNIVAGQILSVAVVALDMSKAKKLELASKILNWFGSLIPTYRASMGFMHLVDTSSGNSYCDILPKDTKDQVCKILVIERPYDDFVQCCSGCAEVGNKTCFEKRPYMAFDSDGMGPDMLTLFLNGIIFILLLVLIEVDNGRFFKWLWWNIKNCCSNVLPELSIGVIDEDVIAEAAMVDSMIKTRLENPGTEDNATMLVSGLTKTFYGAVRPAVNNVRFRVLRGECLGLLGVNGAGKTTTFRMLTGDERPTSGDAFGKENTSLRTRTRKFVHEIGYCPQFDAILGELTGEEMLTLMGRLRGVSDSRLKHVVGSLVTLVDITECAKRPSSTYSGGNKRKLSTAMALVGSPSLVFLDEPTSGVDPASRRRVWAAVAQAVSNGQSVVLTSHSMEECEALCSRVIIMSRGQLRCVGSTGHLKAKYGQGYSLQIKLRTYDSNSGNGIQMIEEETYDERVSDLKNIISQKLPGATLTDQHKGMLAYRIPLSIPWGHLFSVMESLKSGKSSPSSEDAASTSSMDEDYVPSVPSMVEDYAASDTSLEQVFLSFAREVNEDTVAHTVPHIPMEIVTRL